MAKFANITYGTKGDTEQYTYVVNDSVNVGDIVQPSVKHYKSGKIYGTTGIIQNTAKETSVKGKEIAQNLDKEGKSAVNLYSGKDIGAVRQKDVSSGKFKGGTYQKPTKNEQGVYATQGGYKPTRYAKETRQGNVEKRETYEQYAEKFKGEKQ